jgi:hypothetical protein
MKAQLTMGTGSSLVVERCQVCDWGDLEQVLFLGYLPPVNKMPAIGETPCEQPSYPALLLRCPRCQLIQIGLIVDPQILFPPEYPYTSGTTRILRENFAELYRECRTLIEIGRDDLVVDIGSNDGTLLTNFAAGHRVQGIEPTNVGNVANERGIPTLISFFDADAAAKLKAEKGQAKIVTATNVFAHIEDVHTVLDNITSLLADEGAFITESHYVHSLVETLQYDTIYHEHLRYYSLHSLNYLLEMHGLTTFHCKRIATHGGSIRVYAARPGRYPMQASVAAVLAEEERSHLNAEGLKEFKNSVALSKMQLYALLLAIKSKGQHIHGIGAPSRATTLINYTGLDDGIIDCVLEVPGSHKIGRYVPGTLIPVLDETRLFEDQPEYALLLSWHIAEELMPKLAQKGYKGGFVIPLPTPRVVAGHSGGGP